MITRESKSQEGRHTTNSRSSTMYKSTSPTKPSTLHTPNSTWHARLGLIMSLSTTLTAQVDIQRQWDCLASVQSLRDYKLRLLVHYVLKTFTLPSVYVHLGKKSESRSSHLAS